MPSTKKKVMDVANPGENEPQVGSKPMVVGHKSLAADPDVSAADKKQDEKPAAEEKQQAPSKKKITLQPLHSIKTPASEVESEDKVATDDQEATAQEKSTSPATAESAEVEVDGQKTSVTIEDDEQDSSPEEKEKDAGDLLLEREKKLQELIKSKKYFVPIKESSGSAVRTFLTTFVLAVLLMVVVAAGLIDAEILDVDIELPFDFL